MITCKASHLRSVSLSLDFTFKSTSTNPRYLCFSESNLSLRNNCLVCASTDRPKWNPTSHFAYGNRHRAKNEYADDEEEEKKVRCEVEVISWRERRIKAQILVNANIDSVWDALTDYERLADFIPNLVSSGTIPCPHPGRIWLEQRGLQQALYWHIEAHVVLDLQEFPNLANDRELRFSMVDGDFKKFEGKWSLKTCKRLSMTTLSYEVNVIPRFNFPAIFLERIIRSDLPVNLQALACRAERNFQGNQNISMTESSLGTTSMAFTTSASIDNDNSLSEKDNLTLGGIMESYAGSNFGPLPPSSGELNSNWGVFGKVCKLDRPCMVDEVHLRRFDGLLENGGVHRCVVACITVKAPVREVWNVLTAYERLPEIVPNLAISKIISRENNKVCILQGKWLLEQLGNHHTLLKYTVESRMHKNSFLSEAIMEEVIYEDLPSNLCAIRDYIEKREAEKCMETSDLGLYSEEKNALTNNDRYADCSWPAVKISDCNGPHSSKRRPRVPGLRRDIEILKAELLTFISEYGQEGFMPMRKQLRNHGRVDIEKAITRMGGFRRIASLMNLSLAYKHRKPKGYWDNLENLQEEISRFQRSWGMDPSYMPSRKSFERAGRYDIARALEKWGGLHEVSRLLSLKVRHPNRQAKFANDKKNDYVASGDEEKTPLKPYVSQDTQKWLMKLKDLDINWVE
ncbi:uncharacterized protein LOC132267351 isoform X2 [Cornus florida]|uniref:uncharacterized protein LOC132267351 isoform X2 n=1 Tax=Cornus florida TaxID=4283 RepID=UPI00289DF7A6|nr:uncharacterized protein LOC132267351 isoform X2 [Cornus florida]